MADKYAVEDNIALTKDRSGVIRYKGEVPELGEGIWYGVELTDGSMGHNDGAVKGKRYFQTEGKRAIFVQTDKIRGKMALRKKGNVKDDEKQNHENLVEALNNSADFMEEFLVFQELAARAAKEGKDNNWVVDQFLKAYPELNIPASVLKFRGAIKEGAKDAVAKIDQMQ